MQTKFLVRSFLVLVILALGTVACGGTTPTADEETTTTEEATETSGSESSDDTVTTTTDDTTDTTITPTDSNTATEVPAEDTDDDDDGVADTVDNCPLAANTDQADLDADGAGDTCDDDDDGDAALDTADNCPLVANPDQTDTDTDGTGDACDEDSEPAADAPTVTAATNTGTALSTGTSTLVATTATSSFALTFSASISETTNIADQVTVNCTSGNQTFTPSAASTDADDTIINNEFVITPDGLPSGEACTLTVAATPVGDGTTSTTETAFLFNTCGLVDGFGDATSLDVCWSAGESNAAKLTDSIDPVAGTATFSIAAGTTTAGEDSVSYSKVVEGATVSLTGNFNAVEGLTAAFNPEDPSSLPDGVLLQAIATDPADPSNSTTISCGIIGNGGTGLTAVLRDEVGSAQTALSTEGTSLGPITIVLKKTGVDFSCDFLQDGVDQINLSGVALSFDDPQSIQGGIFFIHTGDEELKAIVDDLSFSVE